MTTTITITRDSSLLSTSTYTTDVPIDGSAQDLVLDALALRTDHPHEAMAELLPPWEPGPAIAFHEAAHDRYGPASD